MRNFHAVKRSVRVRIGLVLGRVSSFIFFELNPSLNLGLSPERIVYMFLGNFYLCQFEVGG